VGGAMKNIIISLSVLFLIFGCTITVDVNTHEGTLKVVNNSAFDVNVMIDYESAVVLHPNESVKKDWNLSSGEAIEINLQYWTAGGYEIEVTVNVVSGETTTYEINESEGILQLYNDTADDVWYILNDGNEYTMISMDSDIWSWELLENEQTLVTIDYSGFHVFSDTELETVIGGYATDFYIEADGGAIEIFNNSLNFYITEVYLSPSSSADWGDDDLNGIIDPGESKFWTVVPGYWDIWIVDNWGDNFYNYDNYIPLDQTVSFEYTGFRKEDGTLKNIKQTEYMKYSPIEDRVELKIKPKNKRR